MRRVLFVLTLAAVVAACSGSAATSGGPTATPAPTPAAQTPAAATPAVQTPAPADPTATPGAGTTSGAPATPVACSLLTASEAAAALGVPVNPAAPAVDPTENVCSFGGHALADMLKFVEIEVVNPVEFTPTRASVPDVFEITPASGVGEAAYYQKVFLPNNSGTRMSLSVRKGQTVIRIDIVLEGASDAQLKAAEKTLAAAALGRF